MSDFDAVCNKASSSTSKFSATLKSIAANIGIMIAVTLAIKAVQYAWDKFNTTVAEAQANLDETQSTISSLKTQIEELEKIDANALTQGQKDKLENLKEQLAVQQQLEEIEKRRLAREKVGSGNFADYFDKDSYANASLKIQGNIDDYFYGKKIITRNYNNASDEVNRLSSLLEFERSHNADNETLTYTENLLQKAIEEQRKSQEKVIGLQNDLISQKAEVQSWIAEIQGYIDDGSLVGTDLTDAQNKIETLNSQLETINGELEYTNILLYGGDDSWENVLAQKTKYSLDNLLSNGFTEDELQILATLSFDKNASLDELRTILDEAQNMTEDFVDESATSFSDVFSLKDADGTITNLGKISESIDTIQNAYKTLNSAIDEYNETGAFSIDTLQSVIALGDDWLDYLVDEEGNLKLDRESLQQLTLSRLEDMRVQTINNLIDNVSSIKDEESARKYLESTNYATAKSYEELIKKTYELTAAQLMQKGVSEDTAKSVVEKYRKDVDKINKLFDNVDLSAASLGGGSGSKSSTKDYEELYDFFERRIKVLNDSVSLLKANLENVNGSFAKNNLISAQSAIYQEELKNYTDALAMYQQKANEALATIPSDIAEKVKNGAVNLTTFMGESGEEVATAIKDYEKWADKVSECSIQLAELKETLRDLELEKFNNIIEDFTNQFDLRDKGINLITKQIDLLKEAGEMIGESFYVAQKDQATKQLALLQEEKIKLAEQLSSALSSGLIEKGTDEWYEMVTSLQEVDGSIIDCKKSIEEFDNAILDLNWQVFERIQDTFSNLNSELENLADLLDNIDVADDTTGNWTTDAITKLGLLAQQYELSQYKVAQYTQAIEELNKQYADGNYSTTEYVDKLADLTQQQWEAINSSESIKDAIVDLNKTRIDEIIDGIEKEIEAYKELTNSQIEALDASRDLHEYEKSISEKTKSITDLERKISAMQNDNTAATIAKRKKLEEELAKARQDLEETQYQHSIDSQKDALSKQLEDYEKTRNDEIEALQNSLKNQELIISESFETVKQNASLIGEQITQIAQQHGVKVSDSLTSSWKQGENAIASYGEVLDVQSSAFITNIVGVENEVWNLQYKANDTANSLAWMFSTQADNLVNELAQSYYAEGNVLNMTNALQQSLVNTLERGYDVSSIVGSFNSIADAANKTRESLENLLNANSKNWSVTDEKGNVQYFTTEGEAIQYAESQYTQADRRKGVRNKFTITGNGTSYKYAKGTRSSAGGLMITDEEGYELKLPKLSEGKYTIEPEGSQILTKVQTDNIFDWSKLKPVEILPNLNLMNKLPDIVNRGTSNPITIENKVIFTGAVNDANNFAKQIANIADQQITKSWKEFSNAVKY